MSALTPAAIEEALQRPDMGILPPNCYEQLAAYMEILQRWNARLNLTALRSPAEILRRHLLECVFMAQKLPSDVTTLMDYGSGAGFPGLVIAICRPEIEVTLAEAHLRKAAFLREVVRNVGVSAEIYAARVEAMDSRRQFHAVSLRAVEKMEEAIPIALRHYQRYLALLTSAPLAAAYRTMFPNLEWLTDIAFPDSDQRILALAVPRGTAD